MAKSSSEILNELFGTFNTSFNEEEVLKKSPKKKKKHSKEKKKEKEKEEKVKKKTSTKEKEGKSKSEKAHRKAKEKQETNPDNNDSSIPQELLLQNSETATYTATKILLDIEEGEILDDVCKDEETPRKRMRKAPPRNDDQDSPPKMKRKKHNSQSSDCNSEISSRHSSKRKSKKRIEDSGVDPITESRKHRGEGKSHFDQFLDSPRRKTKSRHDDAFVDEMEHSRKKKSRDFQDDDQERSRLHKRRSSSGTHRSGESPGSNRRFSGSPPSEKYGQTKSGITWREPDPSRDAEDNVERTYYFNETRRHQNGRTSRVSRNRSRSRTRNSPEGYGGRRDFSPRRSFDNRRYSRSRSFSRSNWRSGRHTHPDDIIDKAKLLEIARHNAAKLMKNGVLPSDIFSRDQIIAIRAGGKSVDELTSYCQRLAKREALGIDDMSSDSGDEGNRDFINHPFLVKDRPMPSITMNIRNAIPLPVRSAQELAIENAKLKVQFPVSSGTQHRLELEWKPVEEDDEKDGSKGETCKSLVPLDKLPVGTVAPMPQEPVQVESIPLPPASEPLAIMPPPPVPTKTSTSDPQKSLVPVSSGIKYDPPKPSGIKYDQPPPAPNLDIGAIISVRLRSMRKLQANPEDAEAKRELEEATQEMKAWAETKSLEPKFLTAAEITGGPQAWAKKDQLKNATALSGGMGMHLLQRMGWRPGEGLGKNKEGGIEPLALDVKIDKKGLTSITEIKVKEKPASLSMIYDLSGKHPVSALMELCVKRRWGPPNFELCFEHGPPHQKQFVYKVVVNGVEYQPCVATNNKKLAKANSAAFCLQSLGLLPTIATPASSETLRTVPEPPPSLLSIPAETLMPPPSTSIMPNQGHGQALNRKFISPQTSSHTLQTVMPQPVPPPPSTPQPVPPPLPLLPQPVPPPPLPPTPNPSFQYRP